MKTQESIKEKLSGLIHRPVDNNYKALHDSLAAELDALLRDDDDGMAGSQRNDHAEKIAALSSALRCLNELVAMQENCLSECSTEKAKSSGASE